MALPPEILEKILINCDGKTLLTARNVCKQWGDLVDYLSKKTPLWRWCCHEEIPKKELTQYLIHYNKEDPNVWFYVYNNWMTWQNIRDIRFETVLSPADIPRITCIDVFEEYIAVGSEDGRVRIYDQYWKPLVITRHQAEKVSKVTFFYSDSILKIVTAFSKAIIIDDLFGDGYNHLILEDVMSHSIYKNYICYQKHGGRLTIEKLTNSNGRVLEETWFTRVYSPKNITCINMWNGVCTILISNDVRKVNYDSKNILPASEYHEKCLLNFSSIPNSLTSHQTHHILRDDIIIVLYRAENLVDKEYMEVIMLEGGSKYVKKLFNTTEVLEATITCICLYGNTLVLGVDTGIVYFYHVPSWKHFTIKEYAKKIIIGKHPITNIVVRETKNHRKFYITSSFNIHEVIGVSSYF
ncbi:uncharacterized protein LOC123005354 [Tribolium madens]|uniref:uncharacterized protein LOC123005354 n=1 Tax=Tribolium madens TaxID=41895 RepID=UPI001CF7669D|nr:uncharacterized protein LOC123005354 [Tribolium madens]